MQYSVAHLRLWCCALRSTKPGGKGPHREKGILFGLIHSNLGGRSSDMDEAPLAPECPNTLFMLFAIYFEARMHRSIWAPTYPRKLWLDTLPNPCSLVEVGHEPEQSSSLALTPTPPLTQPDSPTLALSITPGGLGERLGIFG